MNELHNKKIYRKFYQKEMQKTNQKLNKAKIYLTYYYIKQC